MELNGLENEVADQQEDNGNVSLTSLNLTITLAFFGIIWSITSYLLFTKWKCTNDETIWESQLLPILKPIWDTYGYPFFKTCCCAQKPKQDQEKALINGAKWKPSQQSAAQINGISGVNGYQSVSSVNSANRHQCVGRVNSADGYLSINGYQAVNIDGENAEEKSLLDDGRQPDLTGSAEKTQDCEHGANPGDTELPKEPLYGSSEVIFMFSLAQILARPFIITVNIVYLILRSTDDINQSLYEPDGYNFTGFTDYMMYVETITLITGPISNAIYWVCCWRQCHTSNSCRKFLEFMRFYDLQFIIVVAPFSNVHLYALGGWWYIVIIVRLTFYAITFAAAVVAGMRFVCACYCKVFFTCGCDNDVLEIRNKKHLFLEIVFHLIPIFIKMNTSSSAIATFVKLGGKGGPSFRSAYAAFSIIRSITSLFSLVFSGAMLRWAVLKKEHKWEDRSWLTKWLRFLNKYQPHIHGSFFFDMLTYFGLLVLNLILLDLVSERCYYWPYNC